MKPEVECAPCLFKWIYERTAVLADEGKRFQLTGSVLGVLATEQNSVASVGSISNKITDSIHDSILASVKYYEKLKLRANEAADGLLPAA